MTAHNIPHTHIDFHVLNIQNAQSLVLIRRAVSYSYLIILIATVSYYATLSR